MSSLEIIGAEGLPAVRLILPQCHQDRRGFFAEVWREDALKNAGLNRRFVQENHALSHARGTIRGLHFQIGDCAQAKLIRCTRGSIFGVAVDIRRGSPTFGRHAAVVLSAENWTQLYGHQELGDRRLKDRQLVDEDAVTASRLGNARLVQTLVEPLGVTARTLSFGDEGRAGRCCR
jgi:hypothetical protein